MLIYQQTGQKLQVSLLWILFKEKKMMIKKLTVNTCFVFGLSDQAWVAELIYLQIQSGGWKCDCL